MNKVIFLDRDGTINIDEEGYISSPEKFELFPFASKTIKGFNDLGYKVVVVTNQSGIARGYYNHADLKSIHEKMIKEVAIDGGVIDDILIAPYHPKGTVEPFNIVHEDRKPGIGLLKKYYAKCNFSTSESFMIGDKLSDIEFGKRFNLKTILVLTGNGKKTLYKGLKDIKPDYIVENLSSVLKILNKSK
jgi:histidinol-phosphate phosphatase family protein